MVHKGHVIQLRGPELQLGFPTGRDSATCWDKGTTGQAQNLAKVRAGPGQPKFGTGRDSQKPGQNGTEQKRLF